MVTLLWVSLPWATFGVLADGRWIVAAAPIAKWAIGKSTERVYDHYLRKGAEIRVVP
jgi:hypothetical protein